MRTRLRYSLLWPALPFVYARGAGVFSKQLQCDTAQPTSAAGKETLGKPSGPKCREVLAGLINLNSDETFNFETFNVKDLSGENSDDAIDWGSDFLKDVTVNLKVEKSPLLVVYDLVYEQTVVGGISEEVYDYTWAAASGSVFDKPDFEPERCADKKYMHELIGQFGDNLQGSNELIKGGRVCGCVETGWGSSKYTSVKRSALNCNAWPAVFRPSSTIWASRHCARIQGPTYDVYSVRNWRWEFQIKIELERVVKVTDDDGASKSASRVQLPTLKREYFLNWTDPEVYDKEFDFRFRIVFSIPQAGALPPDLSSKFHVLIPNLRDGEETWGMSNTTRPPFMFNETTSKHLQKIFANMPEKAQKLDSMKSRSLLVPSKMSDLTGNSCDKVGVSLFKWAQEDAEINSWLGNDAFCNMGAGSCLRNQPNDLLSSDKTLWEEGKKAQYILVDQRLPGGWSSGEPLLLDSARYFLDSPEEAKTDSDKSTESSVATPKLLAWPTTTAHNTALEIFLNSTEIAWMTGSAQGQLEEIVLQTIEPSTMVEIHAVVRNKDSYPSRFSLTTGRCLEQESERDFNSSMSTIADLEIAPVSRTLAGNESDIFVLVAERPSGLSMAAQYACKMKLLDSKGQVMDHKDVNVTFSKRILEVSSLRRPDNSEANVSRFVVNEYGVVSSPSLRGESGGLFGEDGHTKVSSVKWLESPQCSCAFGNMWCFAMNFIECTKRIRQTVSIIGVVVLAVVLTLMCGPTAIQLMFGVWRHSARFFRKRIHKMSAEVSRQKRLETLCVIAKSEPDSNRLSSNKTSASSHKASPCHWQHHEQFSPDALAFMRESLMNTKGRKILSGARNYKVDSGRPSTAAATMEDGLKPARVDQYPKWRASGPRFMIPEESADEESDDDHAMLDDCRYRCWSPPRRRVRKKCLERMARSKMRDLDEERIGRLSSNEYWGDSEQQSVSRYPVLPASSKRKSASNNLPFKNINKVHRGKLPPYQGHRAKSSRENIRRKPALLTDKLYRNRNVQPQRNNFEDTVIPPIVPDRFVSDPGSLRDPK